MCTNPNRPWPAWDGSFDFDYRSIIKRIKGKKKEIAAAESVYITGGEPTMHPRFLDILKYLTKNFPEQKIKLLTNGRKFFYSDFAREVLKVSPQIEIDLSLHGFNPQIHEKITRAPGSFSQAIHGLENLLYNKTKGQKISIRIVLSAFSYKHIGRLLGFLAKQYPQLDRVVVIFPEMEEQALKNSRLVRVSYRQVRPFLEKCLPLFPLFNDFRLYHFPLCVLSRKMWPYIWRTLPAKELVFSKNCAICRGKKFCLGVHSGYFKDSDLAEFRPILKNFLLQKPENKYSPVKIKKK